MEDWRVVELAARRISPELRLPRDTNADLRIHRAVRAHGGRGDRHRDEGDVHLSRPKGEEPHAAAGEHRVRDARVSGEWSLPGGGHRPVLLRRAHVPVRPAAGREIPAVPPDRRRSDRIEAGPRSTPRSSKRASGSTACSACRSSRCGSTASAAPCAGRDSRTVLAASLEGLSGRALRGVPRADRERIRSAYSTARSAGR